MSSMAGAAVGGTGTGGRPAPGCPCCCIVDFSHSSVFIAVAIPALEISMSLGACPGGIVTRSVLLSVFAVSPVRLGCWELDWTTS